MSFFKAFFGDAFFSLLLISDFGGKMGLGKLVLLKGCGGNCGWKRGL
ncbi:MAG: hypothetical protein ACI4VN_04375 [Clostridia bacterium]